MRYGVPYQGSKNKIANWVVSNLPAGETLVDLFAGGCAVTHAAMLSGKWDKFVINDLSDAPKVFCDAIDGKYRDEKRWISREDFFRLKDSDSYVSLCWSFGNNRKSYIYSKKIEPWKKALHYARVFGDTSLLREFGIESDGSRLDIKAHHDEYSAKYSAWMRINQSQYDHEMLQGLESLERLQSLESLERLQRLQRLESDYREVKIPDDAIVYADPPYRGTCCDGYKSGFDTNAFDEWLSEVPFMVIVSEYTAPRGCVEVARIHKIPTMGTGNKGGCHEEKLFVQERLFDDYVRKMKF